MRMNRLGEDGNASELETRAGAFLADARSIADLDDREIGAIRRRLLNQRPLRRRPYLLPAVAALAVLLAGGTVMAVVGGWRPRLPRFGARATVPTPAPRPTQSRIARTSQSFERAPELLEGKPQDPSLPALEGPSTEPTPSPPEPPAKPPAKIETHPAPATVFPVATRRSIRPEASQPVEQPSPSASVERYDESVPSSEAESLSEALASWRRNSNAEAALALLAAHEQRFAHGAFAIEAKVARAEILLTLGQRSQALLVLDSLSLEMLPRARELHTVRGELRTQAGRCQEAREDLRRVLLESGNDELGQRAARALAKCP